MVQRVGKEILVGRHPHLVYSALYGVAVHCVYNNRVVTACGYGTSKLLVCLGLACSHLHESRGDDNALVVFAYLEVLKYFKSHLRTLRVRIVCVIKYGYAVCNLHRETVLHWLQTCDCIALLACRHAKVVGHSYCRKNVQQVAGTQQTAAVLLPAVEGERYSACTVYDVACLVVAVALSRVSYDPAVALYALVAPDVLRVEVDDSESVGRQRVDELELCILDVLHALECLKVHLAHGGNNTYCGVYQVAYLLDVVVLLRTHLHDEYLMIRAQLFAYGTYYAQQSVEVTRCHKHVVLLGEYAGKVVLGACLAETAGNANDCESLVRLYYALCVIVVVAVDGLLYRCVHKVGKQHHQVRQQQHCAYNGGCPFACE